MIILILILAKILFITYLLLGLVLTVIDFLSYPEDYTLGKFFASILTFPAVACKETTNDLTHKDEEKDR